MGMKWIVMIGDCAVRCASSGDEERRKRKLDPVGSSVRYELVKLCTGSV